MILPGKYMNDIMKRNTLLEVLDEVRTHLSTTNLFVNTNFKNSIKVKSELGTSLLIKEDITQYELIDDYRITNLSVKLSFNDIDEDIRSARFYVADIVIMKDIACYIYKHYCNIPIYKHLNQQQLEDAQFVLNLPEMSRYNLLRYIPQAVAVHCVDHGREQGKTFTVNGNAIYSIDVLDQDHFNINLVKYV